jgi:hypothetical protein
MTIFEVFCPECEASFTIELTEEGSAASTPENCPFCMQPLDDEDFTIEDDGDDFIPEEDE